MGRDRFMWQRISIAVNGLRAGVPYSLRERSRALVTSSREAVPSGFASIATGNSSESSPEVDTATGDKTERLSHGGSINTRFPIQAICRNKPTEYAMYRQ